MLIDVVPMRRVSVAALAAALALALAGCGSGRFGGAGSSPASHGPADTPFDAVTPSVPSGSVTAEPLGPPGGVSTLGGGGGEVAPFGGGSPEPPPTLGGGGGGGAPPPASRSAAVGSWTAREASGTCKVNLSSTPSLDLYRASAGGCSNKELSRVTSWDFRDGEVYLFQPGGAVAARLRPGGGGLNGVLSKSGAPLTLTRG